MESGMFFFRIKASWTGESDKGALVNKKSEELVLATCYTEAEKVAMELFKDRTRFSGVVYDIIKTKIGEILLNSTMSSDDVLTCGLVTCIFEEDENTEVGLYGVVVQFMEEQDNGKVKTTKETIYVPATSANDAIGYVTTFLDKNEMRDWLVRDVKFDKAQSILVSPEFYKSNIEKLDA